MRQLNFSKSIVGAIVTAVGYLAAPGHLDALGALLGPKGQPVVTALGGVLTVWGLWDRSKQAQAAAVAAQGSADVATAAAHRAAHESGLASSAVNNGANAVAAAIADRARADSLAAAVDTTLRA